MHSNLDLSEGKSIREIQWKQLFRKLLERANGSENLSQSLQPSPLPQPSLTMQFDLSDTECQGHFLQKTKQHPLLSALPLGCCDSPLTKVTVVFCTQNSYMT